MVFQTASQPRDSYHLWRVFLMPTKHGSVPAVAIPSSWRGSVTGIYSSMVGIIFVGIWVFIIAVIRKRHGGDVSIHRVAFHEEARFMKFKSWTDNNKRQRSSSWVGWTAAVFIVWVTNMVIGPALVSQLVIDTGAPANSAELFFPQGFINTTTYTNQQKRNNALKPSVLRALSITELNTPQAIDRVELTQSSLGQVPGSQPPAEILQFDYSYNLSARDFGMQHFHSLAFTVQGSCYTEYSWFQGGGTHNSYYLWNNNTASYDNIVLSANQFAIPRAFFYLGSSSNTASDASNQTYAVIVSTAGKYGFTQGTDPWYLTAQVPNATNSSFPYIVMNDRPALSCWETNGWTWDGSAIGNTWDFIYSHPNHSIPTVVRDVLYTALNEPGIITTGQSLDTINLAVADQDLEESFSPATGSIFKDLQRMLITTFVWNSNIFLDMTLYNANTTYGTQNIVLPENRKEIADFVVYTANATAMSLIFIIVVPCLLLLISLLNWTFWRHMDDNYGPCEEEHGNTPKLGKESG